MKKSLFSHLKFAAQANQADGRWKTISRGEERATQLIVIVVMVAAIAAIAALTGCAHPVAAAYTAPVVAPVASALSTTRSEITTTRQAISRAQASAAKLATVIPSEFQGEFSELQRALAFAAEHVQAADSNAALTQTNLFVFDTAVTNQTAKLNKTTDRLNYIEPKYQKAVGLIWKWRLYFFGLAGALLAGLLIKYGSRIAVTAASLAAKVP